MSIDEINILEQVTDTTAKQTTECIYPNCEKCFNYCNHYCTVPIVVTKQMYMMLTEQMEHLKREVKELWDEMFTEEIEVEIGKDGKLYCKSHAPCIVIRDTP